MLKDISWRYFDFWLLGAVVLATAFGTTMIRSAVAGNEELLPLSNRQIYFALVGIVLIFLVAAIDYRYWMALYRPIAFVMSLFLFALFLRGIRCSALVSSWRALCAADRVCQDCRDLTFSAVL
jgi:cell division protein FtsW (lipid II flippase)